MAVYGRMNRGYTTYNGMERHTDDWNKMSCAETGYPDHVRYPEIIDAGGRRRPIISYTPNHNTESYVSSNETIVEEVRTPMVTEYKYSSPAKVEPFKDYGVNKDQWRRPSSLVHDRPYETEEFVTNIQTEVSRPTRPGFLSTPYWHNNRNGTTGSSDYGNFTNSDWNKPSGNTIRDEYFDEYYRRNDSMREPSLINRDGLERPSCKEWTTPPPSHPLTKPTNNIGAAVELLKEAAHFSSVAAATLKPPFTVPAVSTVPKRDTYTETVDSMEAVRRYGNFNLSSRPFKRGEAYTGTIDSREAMRKYNGTIVP